MIAESYLFRISQNIINYENQGPGPKKFFEALAPAPLLFNKAVGPVPDMLWQFTLQFEILIYNIYY